MVFGGYWDIPVKTDRKVCYERPDMVVIDREENTCCSVDFAIPIDYHIKEKDQEKVDNCMDLVLEDRRRFRVKRVTVPNSK